MIYNVGNLEIKGVSITDNTAGAIANNNAGRGESVANAYGGVFYNDGTLTIDEDTEICGNSVYYSMQDDGSAEALGGAIYNTSTLNLGDVIFSNNKHQDEALNDIYTTANSVINVTGRAEIGSGLQSADNSAQINIQNGGNLVLVGKQTLADGTETVGNNAGYTGALNVAQGGILTLKGTDEADTLAAILANAATKAITTTETRSTIPPSVPKAFDNDAGSFNPSGAINARKFADNPEPTKANAIKYSARSAQPAIQPKNSPKTTLIHEYAEPANGIAADISA